MATHAKVDKFALFLCALFDLRVDAGVHDENWKLKYTFKGSQTALTRMINFLSVALWQGTTKSKASKMKIIKNWIKPTKDEKVFYVDFQFGTYSQMLDLIEENLHITPRNMKRVINKILD